MTIAVCGASGLVGKELCKLLQINSIPYVGTYNSNFLDHSLHHPNTKL